jgi:ABC-2 type transport system ATP-binding protein
MNFSNNDNLITASERYRIFYNSFDFEYYKNIVKKLELNEKDKIVSYSKGMKKKLGLCLALSTNAKYILIDEAFDGVDSLSKNEFKELFFDYIDKNNATIIISSHSINDLENIVDRLIIISGNKVVLNDEFNEISDKYIKYQLAFNEKTDIEKIKELKPVYFKQNDKFIDLIFETDKITEDEIKNLKPQFVTKSDIDYSEFIQLLERR